MKREKYVRTYDGNIAKINQEHKENNSLVYAVIKNKPYLIEDIKQSTPSIIGLIEAGDIITLKNLNGIYRVCDVSNGKIELDYQDELGVVIINNDSDIKSIVTKEQFKSMEYIIGDK